MKSVKFVRAMGLVSAVSLLSVAACGGGSADTSASTSANAQSSGGSSAASASSTGGTTAASATTAPTGNLVANGDAHVGDRTNCPVSGEEFVVTESSPSVVHEGKTYYMCCPGCAGRFRANPQQFITAMQQRAAGGATAPAAH